MALEPGNRIGPYEVLSTLGVGGMGEVYRARDAELDRDVALKVLPEEFANDPERLSRFRREARALARLTHPSIAGIYGLEKSDRGYALVLELVEGPTLAARLKDGPLPPDEVVEICEQVADGLATAHAQGIIHRDLKPANLKLSEGRAKILDFGLAKRTPFDGFSPDDETQTETSMGLVVGTVPYMSPEQALGREVDARSDVFSLGIMIYEMVMGERPFAGNSPTEIIDQILHAEPPTLTGPAGSEAATGKLARIVRGCLAKDREQRYTSAAELLADLREEMSPAESGPTVRLPAPDRATPAYTSTPAPSRRRLWEWDQALAVLFSPVLVYLAWFARKLLDTSWALGMFYVVTISVLLAMILRSTLLVMAITQIEDLEHEARRLTPWTRVMDLITTVALLVMAIGLDMTSYIVTFSLMTGLAAIGIVRVAIVIPLMMSEAFPPGRK